MLTKSAFAFPLPWYSKSQLACIREQSAYYQQASVVDDPDRKTANEYSFLHRETKETLEARYSASGDTRCAGFMGQGQLVIKNDTIVTAAHLLPKGKRSCSFISGKDVPPTLVGLNVSSSESDEQIEKFDQTGQVNTGGYDSAHWDSVFVPLEGELVNALEGLGPNPEAK